MPIIMHRSTAVEPFVGPRAGSVFLTRLIEWQVGCNRLAQSTLTVDCVRLSETGFPRIALKENCYEDEPYTVRLSEQRDKNTRRIGLSNDGGVVLRKYERSQTLT